MQNTMRQTQASVFQPLLPFCYIPAERNQSALKSSFLSFCQSNNPSLIPLLSRERILFSPTMRETHHEDPEQSKFTTRALRSHQHSSDISKSSSNINKCFPSVSLLTTCQTEKTSKLNCNSFGTGLKVHTEKSLERVCIYVCACIYIYK